MHHQPGAGAVGAATQLLSRFPARPLGEAGTESVSVAGDTVIGCEPDPTADGAAVAWSVMRRNRPAGTGRSAEPRDLGPGGGVRTGGRVLDVARLAGLA